LINLKKEKKELPQKKASIFDDSDSDEVGLPTESHHSAMGLHQFIFEDDGAASAEATVH